MRVDSLWYGSRNFLACCSKSVMGHHGGCDAVGCASRALLGSLQLRVSGSLSLSLCVGVEASHVPVYSNLVLTLP